MKIEALLLIPTCLDICTCFDMTFATGDTDYCDIRTWGGRNQNQNSRGYGDRHPLIVKATFKPLSQAERPPKCLSIRTKSSSRISVRTRISRGIVLSRDPGSEIVQRQSKNKFDFYLRGVENKASRKTTADHLK